MIKRCFLIIELQPSKPSRHLYIYYNMQHLREIYRTINDLYKILLLSKRVTFKNNLKKHAINFTKLQFKFDI